MVDQDDTVTVRQWTDLVRRCRLGRTVKAAAFALGTYADFDTGRRVRPGIARLAVDAELHYSTAKAAVARLREVGLITLVRRGRARGHADEYRLTIGPALLDHIEVLTPAAVTAATERMRAGRRRRTGADDPDGPGGGQSVRPARPPVDNAVRPAATAVRPVDNPDVRPARPAVPAEVTGECTAGRTVVTDECTAGRAVSVRPAPTPPTSHRPTTTPTSQLPIAVDRDHQAAGEDVDENRDSRVVEQAGPPDAPAPLPDRCPHGLRARRRPDGSSSCALCRHEARAADDHPPRPGWPTLTAVA